MLRVLDTSALTRYLTLDDPSKANAVRLLLKSSKDELLLPDVLVAEQVWLLGSFYKVTKKDIGERIEGLLSIKKIKMNRNIITHTLSIFVNFNISWVDAYACALVQLGEASGIYSYDRGIDKIPGVKRLEP